MALKVIGHSKIHHGIKIEIKATKKDSKSEGLIAKHSPTSKNKEKFVLKQGRIMFLMFFVVHTLMYPSNCNESK